MVQASRKETPDFGGARVLAFESRRAREIAELIRMAGGQPTVAQALAEVPREENAAALVLADRLQARTLEIVAFLTGVGARYLRALVDERDGPDRFAANLRLVTVAARGPKPIAVLREWDVPVHVQAPEPNTWRELLTALASVPGRRVALQEYGKPNPDLVRQLEEQGREVLTVPVYQWKLPENREPLYQAIDALTSDAIGAILFTTGVQVEHLLQAGAELGKTEPLRHALAKAAIYSIGPTCTEALAAAGFRPKLEPSHPKMGLLVREAAIAFKSHWDNGGEPS